MYMKHFDCICPRNEPFISEQHCASNSPEIFDHYSIEGKLNLLLTMSLGTTVGYREDPGLVIEVDIQKLGEQMYYLSHLAFKSVFRLENSLIMDLVVQGIGLPKAFLCFQPSPEAGDRAVSFHILCSPEQLLCWHIAWQSSKGSCAVTARLECRKRGWAAVTQPLSVSAIIFVWPVPLTLAIPKVQAPDDCLFT